MQERQSTLEADGRSGPEVDEQVENTVASRAVVDAPSQESEVDGVLAADAAEGGRMSALTRFLLVAVIVLGAGAAGYSASRIWPLPSGWIWTAPAWSMPPQEAKTFSRRAQPKLVLPAGPVRAELPASTALNRSHEAVLGQTTVNEPVKTESGPALTEALGPATKEASAGTVREAPSDATLQDDAASQKRSGRAAREAREQSRPRGTPRLADSVPSGGRQDPTLKSFMATPNNF